MTELNFVCPFFIVADLERSLEFYVTKLGFEVQYETSYFAMINRGQVSLMLKGNGDPTPNHLRYEWAFWDAHVSVSDPDMLFEEFDAKGVEFHQGLQDNSDNLRGFSVVDPNGYRIFFAKPL